jgi:hypothetical protein
VIFEPAAGIYGGAKSVEAYLLFMGVDSLEELEQEQLCLFPIRARDKARGERPSAEAA